MRHFMVFVFSIGLFSYMSATRMSSCTDSKGIYPTNVNFSTDSYECEASPCAFILGCPSLIEFDFKAPRYLEHIQPKIHASCMGVELDYPTGQDDACEGFTNTQCPIVKGEKVNYKYSLTIPAIFPEVTVTLAVSLVDEDLNEDVVCFEFDINVKKDSCPSSKM